MTVEFVDAVIGDRERRATNWVTTLLDRRLARSGGIKALHGAASFRTTAWATASVPGA